MGRYTAGCIDTATGENKGIVSVILTNLHLTCIFHNSYFSSFLKHLLPAVTLWLCPFEDIKSLHIYFNSYPKTISHFPLRMQRGEKEEKSQQTETMKVFLETAWTSNKGLGPQQVQHCHMWTHKQRHAWLCSMGPPILQRQGGYLSLSEVCIWQGPAWDWGSKGEVADTLAKSLAAFCRYCQSIQVPKLFMTLSWIFSWIRWYVWASSCKLLLWFSHYKAEKEG